MAALLTCSCMCLAWLEHPAAHTEARGKLVGVSSVLQVIRLGGQLRVHSLSRLTSPGWLAQTLEVETSRLPLVVWSQVSRALNPQLLGAAVV